VRWHGGCAGFDDRTRFIAPTDLGGNGLMQPLKFGVVEVPERGGEVVWQGDPRRGRRTSR